MGNALKFLGSSKGRHIVVALASLVYVFWSAREIAGLKTANRILNDRCAALAGRIPEPAPAEKMDFQPAGRIDNQAVSLQPGRTNQAPALVEEPERHALGRDSAPAAGRKKNRPQPNIADLPDLRSPAAGLLLSLDNGPLDQKIIALTFDGGSLCNAAAEILDTLSSRNVKATFFLTGEFIRRFPETVKRIVGDGHEAGNHTATHPHLTTYEQDHTQTALPGVSAVFLERELHLAEITFNKTTGRPFSPLWRAPYGEVNAALCRWAQAAGYLHVGWRQGPSWSHSLDCTDWVADKETKGYHSPQQVLDKIVNAAGEKPAGVNGGIILMHLGTERVEPDAQVHRVLGALIDRLRGRGYSFVTAGAMAAAAGADLSLLPRRPAMDHL